MARQTLETDDVNVGVERRPGLELAAEDIGGVADDSDGKRRAVQRDRWLDASPGGRERHDGAS